MVSRSAQSTRKENKFTAVIHDFILFPPIHIECLISHARGKNEWFILFTYQLNLACEVEF